MKATQHNRTMSDRELFEVSKRIMEYNKETHGMWTAMEIRYSRDAIKFLENQTKRTVERIREGIFQLVKTPPEGDIATLKGYSDNRKRLRIGSWRVIFKYTVEHTIDILYIIDIGNRGDIYK